MASETWTAWYQMALASQRSAHGLAREDPRSCASRIYYAAYQAVTAVLLYRGGIPPDGREAWSHADTPKLILEQWQTLIPSQDSRKDMANRLRTLYKIRVDADYISSSVIDVASVRAALKNGNFLVATATDILIGK